MRVYVEIEPDGDGFVTNPASRGLRRYKVSTEDFESRLTHLT